MLKLNKKGLLFMGSLVLSASLILSGCGGGNSSSPASQQKAGKQAQGVTDKEILIGNWATQSGSAALYGAIAKGIDAYFQYVNDQGGVNGRKLKLVTYDEEYQPSRAVAIAKKLIEEDKVFAIVGNDCTSCNKAALPQFKKSGIPVVGVSSGSDIFVNPVIPNIYGLLTNYGIEARIFVNYAVDELKGKRIGIFYQNDDFGKSGYEAAVDELKKKGMQPVAEVSYNSTDVDFSSPALKMKEANPDVILSFSITKPTAAYKKELSKVGVNVPFIVTSVAGADNNMFNLAGDSWKNVYSSSWVAMVGSGDPKVNKYVEALKKYGKDLNPSGPAQWGWAEAEVLVEAIRRCGNDLTWENLNKQLETFKDWNEGLAFNVSYGPDNHYGTTSVVMIKDQNGKMAPASDVIKYKAGK
ncbi:ABC transporter substrate-binding protein [Effusibacillus consociatus]|uniref:ABC transporter substrate-binding protein n=1 Tax=Effusibacillus consociatus TaxID=1117041 RepID=A0ABV9Q266_9BACL